LQDLQFLELHLAIVNWSAELLHLKRSSSLTEQVLRSLKLSVFVEKSMLITPNIVLFYDIPKDDPRYTYITSNTCVLGCFRSWPFYNGRRL